MIRQIIMVERPHNNIIIVIHKMLFSTITILEMLNLKNNITVISVSTKLSLAL